MKLLAVINLLAASVAMAQKPTVYLIRHGEKPPGDAFGLSEQGLQRAQCLRGVFGATSAYNIGHIMAQKPKNNGKRKRPYDTVQPLADDLHLTVDTSCGRDDAKCVKNAVYSYKGPGNILICWEHKALHDLAEALGDDDAPNYPSDSFDLIWVDKPDYGKIDPIEHQNCNVV